jgi:hypothetical protein
MGTLRLQNRAQALPPLPTLKQQVPGTSVRPYGLMLFIEILAGALGAVGIIDGALGGGG